MSAPLDSLVRFGAFELDLRTGELRKAGVRINLPEQPLQVLKTLLDRPGELVTREELRQRLWSAETFVDFEHGLNAAVRRLRDALGDAADVPRFVETLPRRGYRFIAPVAGPAVVEQPSAPTPEIEDRRETSQAPDPPARPTQTRIQRPVLVAASILVSALVLWGSGYVLWRLAASPSTLSATRFMLAVLPFENLTGDPDQEYISDGMTEELIAQLGADGSVTSGSHRQAVGDAVQEDHQTSRSNRFRPGREPPARGKPAEDRKPHPHCRAADRHRERESALGRTVRARRDGPVDASARSGGGHYPPDHDELGVARSNVDADARRHSTIAEAYEHYLRGRHHLWRRDTAEGFEKAREHFRRAIDLDASYAHAYSGLSDTYTMLGSVGFLPMREAYPLARAAALKALALDDTLAEAHTSLAFILADYDWDWDDSRSPFQARCRVEPELRDCRSAPIPLISPGGGGTRRRSSSPGGRAIWTRCRRTHGRTLAWPTTSPVATTTPSPSFERRSISIRTSARPTSCWDGPMSPRVYLIEPSRSSSAPKVSWVARPDVITPMAYVLARAGRRREALATLDELRRIAKPRDPSPFRLAYVHIGLGETDVAFDWLEKAVEARDWQLGMLKVEPAFDGLRSDPRFAALLERVGLPR